MITPLPNDGLELRSLITPDGRLEVSLATVPVSDPAEDEVVVRVEAAPINPSDLGLLFGPADLSVAVAGGDGARPTLSAPVPAARMASLAARIGQPMPVGNEGAGVVVRAGAGAAHLLGKTVATLGGGMYAQYRTVNAASCLVLEDGTTAAEGASCFVNPLTALGMVETMRREGHTALVHTAAASNLGQMLNRACLKDGIGLVNIVRSTEQAAILRGIGAVHVCDSTAPTFEADLTDALAETGATLAFDAIGGGPLAGQILVCMEAAIGRRGGEYSRYGSNIHKQVYIYGGLNMSPTVLDRGVGMAWGVGGWLLPPFLARIGPEAAQALRQRVVAELKTTFASRYTAEISLSDALRPDVVAAYARRATGEKYLINPSLG